MNKKKKTFESAISKEGITLTTKNILGVFEEAKKKLDEMSISSIEGGFIMTPYGTIAFRKNKLYGNKKAINWFKKTFYEPTKTRKK